MLSRLDLDIALTGNVEVARDMRDIAQEKMSLMKLQIQVLQNTAPADRVVATHNMTQRASVRDHGAVEQRNAVEAGMTARDALPEGLQEESADSMTPSPRIENVQLQPVADNETTTQPKQNLPGAPIDAG